jgi:hypothetical protein
MEPTGYPAPRSAAALALALVDACDAHELCRAMVGASGRSSSDAPAGSRMVTCNLAQAGMLCNSVPLRSARPNPHDFFCSLSRPRSRPRHRCPGSGYPRSRRLIGSASGSRHSPRPDFIGLTVRLFGWSYSFTFAETHPWAAAVLVDEFDSTALNSRIPGRTALPNSKLRAKMTRPRSRDRGLIVVSWGSRG